MASLYLALISDILALISDILSFWIVDLIVINVVNTLIIKIKTNIPNKALSPPHMLCVFHVICNVNHAPGQTNNA